MKHLFSLLCLLATAYVNAQDCNLLKENDQFTQQPKVSTRFMKLGGGDLLLSIDATKTEIVFDFAPGNTGQTECYDSKNTITFWYEGGRLRNFFRNTGYMNCKGLLQLSFRNIPNATPGNIRRLGTNKVIKIEITDEKKKSRVIELSPEEQEMFMKMANCLFEEAKTLGQ